MTAKSLYINDIWLLLAFNYAKSVTEYVSWAAFRPSTVSLFILRYGCLVGLCYFWRSQSEFSLRWNSICTPHSGVCNRLCWQFSECCCHEIKLMVEWMLHDLSTLASRVEWSGRNKNMTERETKNRVERDCRILSAECLRNVSWITVEWINEKLFMQRRKMKCLNDSSQNKTAKWLNIYLCCSFSLVWLFVMHEGWGLCICYVTVGVLNKNLHFGYILRLG